MMHLEPIKLFFRLSAALFVALALAACSESATDSGLERGDGGMVAGQPAQGNNSPASTSTAEGTLCFARYVQNYPDLNAAYRSSGSTKSMADWGVGHYLAIGQAEGRALPAGCKAPSSGGATGNNPSMAPAFSAADYQLLYRLNANANNGRTVRWSSKTIGVNRSDPAPRSRGGEGLTFALERAGLIFREIPMQDRRVAGRGPRGAAMARLRGAVSGSIPSNISADDAERSLQPLPTKSVIVWGSRGIPPMAD